ncbi:unnamed protein product [Eruca vesicaria subsp. sativa]|uniref:Uncharacterized protein n=1 Tax=Eruca vesicaria subsp. sativa TaxID=29727 RepID=A0ABC8KDA0_ERUVS|nr:unnamed protein product [Eruca vesicaria subsp. sativa]
MKSTATTLFPWIQCIKWVQEAFPPGGECSGLLYREREREHISPAMAAVESLAREMDTADKLRLPSSTNGSHVKSKDDDSPVTGAAIVSWVLAEIFGTQNLSTDAEEDTESLFKSESLSLLGAVSNTVNEALSEAHKYGLPKPDKPLQSTEILNAIGRCNLSEVPTEDTGFRTPSMGR